ncbi:MAG: PRC-barrel domain-containing protein [Clostridiales bacterium]|nr:PRC-barrel domain-containing protein [Clostridiales bacterium]
MEKASRRIISMPVYSISEGQYVGNVKNLVMDPRQKCLIALLVERGSWGRTEKIIPFSKIRNIGDDAITIDKTACVERKTNMPQIMQYVRQPASIHGAKVLTDDGKTIGKVEEYYLDTQNGKISHLKVSGSFFGSRLSLSAEDIVTIAARAIIVANSALERAEVMESAVGSARGKASSLLSGTIEASRRFSRNLVDSINKYKAAQMKAAQDGDEDEEEENREKREQAEDRAGESAEQGMPQNERADMAAGENIDGNSGEERKVN